MSLSTQGSAWNVITPQSRNYYPIMPALAGPGITFTTTGSPPSGGQYCDGTVQNLYLVMMQEMGGSCYIPFLATDFGLWVEKDIQTYGALMTATDPNKQAGGGAILMGHGLTSSTDPPCIELTDYGSNSSFGTLYIYKLDSNWNRLPGDLNIGNLTATSIAIPNNSEVNWTTYGNQDWTNLGGFMFVNSYNNLNFEFKAMCHNFGDGNLYPIMQMAYWNNGSFTTIFQFDMMGDFSYAGSLIYMDSMDDIAALRAIKPTTDKKGNEIYDPATLKFLQNEQGLYSLSACIGWELSIQRKFLAKHDAYDQQLDALTKEIANLQAQLQQLKSNVGAS